MTIHGISIIPWNIFVLYSCLSFTEHAVIFLWRRAPQQMLRTHRSLETYCDKDEEKNDQFFYFSK
jgi:hypothetical protein